MDIKHVDIKSMDDILLIAKDSITTDPEKMDDYSKVLFYKSRLRFLESESTCLELREKALREELEKSIAEFRKMVIEKGCEIASVKQMWFLALKEIGACESKLMDLNAQTKEHPKEVI